MPLIDVLYKDSLPIKINLELIISITSNNFFQFLNAHLLIFVTLFGILMEVI